MTKWFSVLLTGALLATLPACDQSKKRAQTKAEEQSATEEFKRVLESKAVANAPLIAARNGLPLEQVKAVLLTMYRKTYDEIGFPRFFFRPPEEDQLTPLLAEIAAAQRLSVSTIAQIVFDDRQLRDCSDKDE